MLEEERRAIFDPNRRMIEIDIDHGFGARLIRLTVEPDRERPAFQHSRDIARRPAVPVQKQVLATVEPKQGYRLVAASLILLQQDRKFTLNIDEFCRHHSSLIHGVAEGGSPCRADLQISVVDIVQKDDIRHAQLPFPIPASRLAGLRPGLPVSCRLCPGLSAQTEPVSIAERPPEEEPAAFLLSPAGQEA